MNDPCRACQYLEARNEFLKQHWSGLLESLNIHPRPNAKDRTADKELLHTIIESSSDCILVWDKECNYLYANQAAIDHVGTTPDKVIGKNIREGLGHVPDFMWLWISRVDKVFQTGKPLHVADENNVGDHIVFSESTLAPVRRPDGTIFAVSVVYRDVTEKKRLEQQLIEDERKYRQLYEQAQIPLYRIRLSDGRMLECNHAMAELLGYHSKQECMEKHCSMAHYADHSRRNELIERLKTEGEVTGFELEIIRQDGSHGWVEISARLDPEKGYIEGAHFDITAQKVLSQAEKAVLGIMMQGKSNKEIAKLLGRSIRTIEDHRSHIMHKLGVGNLVELVQMAHALNHETPEK